MKVRRAVCALVAVGLLFAINPPAGATVDARMVRDVETIVRGRWAGTGDGDRAVAVFRCESGLNPLARNRRSSAFGIAQFLNSTWHSTGITRTSNAWLQIEAAYRLYRARGWSPWVCARQRRGYR